MRRVDEILRDINVPGPKEFVQKLLEAIKLWWKRRDKC